MVYLFLFLVLGGIIIIAGRKLSIYGDIIGDKKKLEKSWIGIVMLASITSLPELITSSSSSLMGIPEMAISNVFGSNFFNIFIIFVIEIFFIRKISFSSSMSTKNIFTGLCSIFITLVFVMGYLIKGLELKVLSIISIIVLVLYFISMKLIYIIEKNESNKKKAEAKINETKNSKEEISDTEYRNTILKFILSSIVVIIAGVGTVYAADKIAVTPIFGIILGQSFVGVILLALATSLPELTVSIQAVKMGNYDMAAGNILGSNLFNLSIIFIADICYLKSGIMSKINNFHILTAILSIFIMIPLFAGMFFKDKKYRIDTLLIGAVYIFGMALLYKFRG